MAAAVQAPAERPKFSLSLQQGWFNSDGWGPAMRGRTRAQATNSDSMSPIADVIRKYPFEPEIFKSEKIGRVIDFTFNKWGQHDDNIEYKVADSRPVKQPARSRYLRKQPKAGAYHQKQLQQKAEQLGTKAKNAQLKHQQQRQMKMLRQHRTQKGFQEWSIEPKSEWKLECEIALSSLPKQTLDARKVAITDVSWSGLLRTYDKRNDRINPKRPVPVEPTPPNITYYFSSTNNDHILEEQIEQDDVSVVATDQILACLMAAPQSKYSWHLKVTKLTNEDGCTKVLIDKRDGSLFDFLTVHETAAESPNPEDEVHVNRPTELSVEASRLNLDISQQMLMRTGSPCQQFERPCFVEPDTTPADKAYRYRRIVLPGREKHINPLAQIPITIVTRADVDAKLPDTGPNEGFVCIRALNEHRSTTTTLKPWKTLLETQKGALLATEIRCNAAKFGRWVAQALIAGCDTLKLVYVSRVSLNDSRHHAVLNVNTYQTGELGTQMGVSADVGWGCLRAILDQVMGVSDGEFILVKDPAKPMVKLYRLPEKPDDEDLLANGPN